MISPLQEKSEGVLSVASSASALKEHVLLHGQLFLGNRGVSFNGVFQNHLPQERCARSVFPELDKLSMLFHVRFLICELLIGIDCY